MNRMSKAKKLIITLITVGIIFASFSAIIAQASYKTMDGKCGDTAEFEIENGVLYIFGTGIVSNGSTIRRYMELKPVETVVFGSGITAVNISRLFNSNSSIKNLIISDTVKQIKNNSFVSCDNLTDIYYAGTQSEWNGIDFGENNELVNGNKNIHYNYELFIQDDLKPRGACGINSKWQLDINTGELKITGTGIVNIPVFESYNGIIKKVIIENGITDVGEGIFMKYPNLVSVTISGSVKSVPYNLFALCSRLNNVTISNGVTEINESAFESCSSLTSIVIPSSVVSIHENAFADCNKLADIYYTGNEQQWGNIDIEYGNDQLYNANIHYNYISGSIDFNNPSGICGNNSKWKLNLDTGILNITGSGDTQGNGLAQSPFASYSKYIKTANVSNGITSIGGFLFSGCYNMTDVTLPDSLKTIGSMAFLDCDSLTNINIPDNVTSISSGAFSSCDNITRLVIPEQVTKIQTGTFGLCSSLSEIVIPESITEIGNSAFEECNNLSDIYYGGNKDEWEQISIGNYNDILKTATVHYNSGFAKSGTYTITDLSRTTNGIEMSVHSNATPIDSQQAIVACYNNGILTDVEIKTISPSDIDQIITFDIDTSNVTLIKGFIWNNTKKLLPVSNVYSLEQ